MILIGGALLLTPGLLTDTIGFSMLIPWTRVFYRRAFVRWIQEKIRRGEATVTMQANYTFGPRPAGAVSDQPGGPDHVIDVTPRTEESS